MTHPPAPAPLPREEIERLEFMVKHGNGVAVVEMVAMRTLLAELKTLRIRDVGWSLEVDELKAEIEAGRAGAERVRSALPVERCGLTKQALVDIETAIGGSYEMSDGRSFWMDAPVVRAIMDRVIPFIRAECERHQRSAGRAALRQAAQPTGRAHKVSTKPEVWRYRRWADEDKSWHWIFSEPAGLKSDIWEIEAFGLIGTQEGSEK